MPNEPAGRRRPFLALWIGAAIVALFVVVATVLQGDAEWARLEAEVDEAVRAANAQLDGERAPVFGVAVEGDAWPVYRRALADADLDQLELFAEGSGADREELATALAAHETVVESLVDGVRRTRVGRSLVWDPDETLQALEGMALGKLLVTAARAAARDGDAEGAATRLAAALRFARDRAAGGSLVDHLGGTVSARNALAELGELVAARRLPRPALERLDAFLADLDDAWPTLVDALRRETAGFGAFVRDAARDGDLITELEIGRLMAWRYLFSDRRLALAWWDLRRTQQELVDSASDLPWSAARVVLEKEPRPEPRDPLGVMTPMLGQWASEPRKMRAGIRILRSAIRFVVSGDAVALADPLSDRSLHTHATADRIRIWSVGADGIDDGGEGSLEDDDGPDLVLEVSR